MFMAALLTRVSWASQVALAVKDPPAKCRKHWTCRFDPWVRKIPWRSKRQPALVFLPGEFHGQRSLEGYSPWGHRELNTSQHEHARTCTHARAHTHTHKMWKQPECPPMNGEKRCGIYIPQTEWTTTQP